MRRNETEKDIAVNAIKQSSSDILYPGMLFAEEPSHPQSRELLVFPDGAKVIHHSKGLTKRESIAVAAMQGLLASGKMSSAAAIANSAVLAAENLIARLNRERGPHAD